MTAALTRAEARKLLGPAGKALERRALEQLRDAVSSNVSAFWPVVPIPAPRQHPSDRWKAARNLRVGVQKYRAFRDEVRARGVWAPKPRDVVAFYLPMPPSWPMVKKIKLELQPHESKPDLDNLLKALLDATTEDDADVWAIGAAKFWSQRPGIMIFRGAFVLELPERPA